jgi:hypothetical protein
MEKEFVPYELALRMKALGFDEKCIMHWWKGKLSYYQMGDFSPTHTSAPLYQQAFRWFREKHDLGHMINGIGHESFIMNIAGVLHIFNAFEFNTYEEAELACLEKLLEIVESKSE